MTTKAVFSFLLILLSAVQVHSQSKPDSLKVIEKPLSFAEFFNPHISFSDPFFLDELNHLKINSSFINDTSSIWLNARLQLGSMINGDAFNSSLQTNILNPLGQQYSASQNMKFLKSVLGAVQVGGVAYLAYKHIKKHGFLKAK